MLYMPDAGHSFVKFTNCFLQIKTFPALDFIKSGKGNLTTEKHDKEWLQE